MREQTETKKDRSSGRRNANMGERHETHEESGNKDNTQPGRENDNTMLRGQTHTLKARKGEAGAAKVRQEGLMRN